MSIETLNDLLIDTQKRRDIAKDAYDKCESEKHKARLWAKFSAFSHVERHLSRLLNSENGVGVSDSSVEHGRLPLVSLRSTSDETQDIGDESEQITLASTTDTESILTELMDISHGLGS